MLTLQERERLAYISGDVTGATLLANREDVEQLQDRIDELETEVASLENEVARLELDLE